ncbi:MAG: hypothetical protein KAG28_03250 [Cocleimonas sp.]|nr:hypothetical protein [Cocleimonas sp.]
MIKTIPVLLAITLFSTLWGCATNTKTKGPALNEAQTNANRNYTTQLQQADRDRNHNERMRVADAVAHANRNVKGGVTYTAPATTVIVPR